MSTDDNEQLKIYKSLYDEFVLILTEVHNEHILLVQRKKFSSTELRIILNKLREVSMKLRRQSIKVTKEYREIGERNTILKRIRKEEEKVRRSMRSNVRGKNSLKNQKEKKNGNSKSTKGTV